MKKRCEWMAGCEELEIAYHDKEWGTPVHDDRLLFEMLSLEGAQAGLSWSTIFKKRENYKKAFSGFDPAKVARFDSRKIERLLNDPGIVRNRLKVLSVVNNAKRIIEIQKEFGSFSEFIWEFVGGKPVNSNLEKIEDFPTKTVKSEEMSKILKQRGFKFVGPIICYVFMQAVGMVNDHMVYCFRYHELKALQKENSRYE